MGILLNCICVLYSHDMIFLCIFICKPLFTTVFYRLLKFKNYLKYNLINQKGLLRECYTCMLITFLIDMSDRSKKTPHISYQILHHLSSMAKSSQQLHLYIHKGFIVLKSFSCFGLASSRLQTLALLSYFRIQVTSASSNFPVSTGYRHRTLI